MEEFDTLKTLMWKNLRHFPHVINVEIRSANHISHRVCLVQCNILAQQKFPKLDQNRRNYITKSSQLRTLQTSGDQHISTPNISLILMIIGIPNKPKSSLQAVSFTK